MWYRRTADQHIRPVDVKALTNQRYCEKWDRVGNDQLKVISDRFFERLWKIENPDADCLLFDTTNYYTFMSSSTPSDMACRGKNKQGRPEERLLAFRTRGEYSGKQRVVVVTYNPATARKRKKNYTLDSKLASLRQELISMRAKVQNRLPHWRDPETIKTRYLRLCERMHLSSDLFVIDLKKEELPVLWRTYNLT